VLRPGKGSGKDNLERPTVVILSRSSERKIVPNNDFQIKKR